ncbi:hypothetical protein COV17_04295 [Candidatus Woesearchaeota archaeon CG10_big_fil_rev_8_21_14_0_10_36_11]|nr:MAG: hypothetical protein COV17_04295 [Candidatus Woesearchaeota archaeon CG10_big_fil_rev_8_21_14_0_10_36_11]
MGKLVSVNFQPMSESSLEFRVSDRFLPPFERKRFEVISPEEANELYFHVPEGRTLVYLITGAQRGDEAKGKAAKGVRELNRDVKWCITDENTHNAGKQENGFSLHLLPPTVADPNIHNYVGHKARVNLFITRKEILDVQEATGNRTLGEDFHLMIDRHATLVTPMNRADDIVGKPNAMGSTCQGATMSSAYAAMKKAPTIEDVLYDKASFVSQVNFQITELNDRIQRDEGLASLGITDMKTFGYALTVGDVHDGRLRALKLRLSPDEITFFSHENPAEYLHARHLEIVEGGLFTIGDTQKAVNAHVGRGEPGVIECVQSVLLSSDVRYSKNRTSAATHAHGSIGSVGLTPSQVEYGRILVFKFGNTSVGGNESTMAGLIRQDALHSLSTTSPISGKKVSFEYTSTLDDFVQKDAIEEAFHQVNQAYNTALREGYSLCHSKVKIAGIYTEFSLSEAKALLTSAKWTEIGVTSKRARICRMDDLVQDCVVYDVEPESIQVRNAVDRGIGFGNFGIVTAYEVTGQYGSPKQKYPVGHIIKPGDELLTEHQTVKACIPLISILKSWSHIYADGTNNAEVGKRLDPHLSFYLSVVSAGHDVMGIGTGPRELVFIREI